jgi:AraC-like DNA-binding protein
MLTYLGLGVRRYGDMPIRIYGRPYWEFQAVLSGSIAPLFPPDIRQPEAVDSSLWVFPPEHPHGWTAPAGTVARIVVCHFDSVPEFAAVHFRRLGWLRVALAADRLHDLHALGQSLDARRLSRDLVSLLHFDKACAELCIIACEGMPMDCPPAMLDRAGYVALTASAWYSEHMAARPSMVEVARAAGCSPSHLRRLFLQARGSPPEVVFRDLRMHRAREMLRLGVASIKEIAYSCGYDNQSCFSRAFRQVEGLPPSRFR